MNFKKKQPAPVNMDELARSITAGEEGRLVPRMPRSDEWKALEYAQPHHRDAVNGPESAEVVIDQVETFGALRTKELDEIVAGADAEITQLKKDAQAVRDMFVKHTNRIADDIGKLREGVRLSMEMMGKLREQCLAIDGEREDVKRVEKVTKSIKPEVIIDG